MSNDCLLFVSIECKKPRTIWVEITLGLSPLEIHKFGNWLLLGRALELE